MKVQLSANIKCAALAGLLWLFYFYFARHACYAGDDFGVIRPLFQGGLWQAIHLHFRPLEYFIAKLSSFAGQPVWLGFSFAAFVMTSSATLILMNSVQPDAEPGAWKLVFCAASPLAFQAYFQVDTVSQALANLFCLLFAIECMKCYRLPGGTSVAEAAWRAAAFGMLCLLSKETSWGILIAGSGLMISRHRLKVLVPTAIVLLLCAACAIWSLTQTDATQGTQYGIKANPLYWLFTVVFSSTVALAPVPTSLVLTGAFTANRILIGVVACGALLALLGFAILLPRVRPSLIAAKEALHSAVHMRQLSDGQIVTMFALAALVPAVFIKAAELYASQMTPFLKTLLVLAMATLPRLSERIFWSVICGFWVLASTINIAFYSVASGYDPATDRLQQTDAENRFYAIIQKGLEHRTKFYSIYSYQEAPLRERRGDCLIDNTEPSVCIPESISSGFPVERAHSTPSDRQSPDIRSP